MFFRPMSCPHCGAPIAEESYGRSLVTCSYCRGTFAPDGRAVYRMAFARSLKEAEERTTGKAITLRGRRYVPELELARSPRAVTLVARVEVPAIERVVLKLARDAAYVERERSVLAAIAASTEAGHAHFATRVPQLVASGVADLEGTGAPAIAVRQRRGYLHTGDDVRRAFPSGLDGRHVVWMWRRVLEVLGFAHRSGWVHGTVSLEHLVVGARDHGVLVVGWASAQRSSPGAIKADVAASAAAMRSLGEPTMPEPLREAIASAEAGGASDAWELADSVGHAARRAYGPPAFHPLDLPPFRR